MSILTSSNFQVNAGLPADNKIVVVDVTARDALPSISRYHGMIVTVQTTPPTTYQLGVGLTNADWILFGGAGSPTWTPEGVTTAPTVGGVASGTDLGITAVSIETTLREIFYPYLGPTVSIVLNPSAGTYEIGSSIAAPIITPTTVRHSNPITTLTLSRSGTGLIHTYTPNPAGGGEPPYTDISGAVTTNTTYTAIVGDGTSTSNGTASYSFLPGIYHGVSSSVLTTGSAIISNFGSSVVLASSRAVTYIFNASTGGGSNHLYIAYPTSFGLPSSTIFDGFTFTDYTVTTASLTNASGYTQNYYILMTNPTYNGTVLTWEIL